MVNLRVLIVEDDPYFAIALEDMLADAGVVVVGRTGLVAAALQIVKTQTVDVACLDIDLGPENSFPVADELAARNIPFIFLTGRDAKSVPPRHHDRPFLSKSATLSGLVPACLGAASSILPLRDPVKADLPAMREGSAGAHALQRDMKGRGRCRC